MTEPLRLVEKAEKLTHADRTAYYREYKRKKRQEARKQGLKRIEVWCYPETEAAVRAYVTRQNAKVEKQRAE